MPSPADLPDPGIEPGSPVLQVDSLLTELNALSKLMGYIYGGNKHTTEEIDTHQSHNTFLWRAT